MQDCDLHTVLRLPRGTFTPYTPGTKTYAIFFTKGRPTEKVWLYDGRANVPGITKKDRPLTAAHFAEFEALYGSDPYGHAPRTETERFHSFTMEQVKAANYKLDSFKWIKDDSLDDADSLPEPEELATDAIAELEGAIAELNEVLRLLESPSAEKLEVVPA